jgi:hypothetical protein
MKRCGFQAIAQVRGTIAANGRQNHRNVNPTALQNARLKRYLIVLRVPDFGPAFI